jgi:hypothetical protein
VIAALLSCFPSFACLKYTEILYLSFTRKGLAVNPQRLAEPAKVCAKA